MLLRAYVSSYISERDVSAAYAKQLLWSVDRLERFLGKSATLTELSDGLMNRWISAMLEEGLSRRTARSQRGNILTLWRAAYDARLVDALPGRIKRVRCDKLVPKAEPADRIAMLVTEAKKLDGQFRRSRVSRMGFWVAFILTLWESGLRLKDMLRLRSDWIGENGVLVVVQSKTGWPVVCPLSAECLQAIRQTNPLDRERIFGDALSRSQIQKQFRRLAKAVGLRGGTKLIRRSGATAVEIAKPGSATGYLGHKTPGMAYQFYVDPRLIQDSRPMPPHLPT